MFIARSVRRLGAMATAASLVALGLIALSSPAGAATPPAGLSPVLQRNTDQVTADALPSVQIDGVVWAEQVVGNTVFAGGDFANARPAGAAAGTSLTPRADLLSFDIRTGELNTGFAPSLNAQAKALALSPDGTRLYVGGSFTTANGVNRYRIAAYDVATGALVTTWAPALNASVYGITVTNNAVYVSGAFTLANSVARAHLAAFDPKTGALLGWAPTSDDIVQALQVTPDGSRVIVAGQFQHINGATAYGLAAVDAVTGASYPWAASQVVQDSGPHAAFISLSTDGKAIYSTSYVYGEGGNFEGVLSADPDSGTINWLADCHGDTYGTFGVNKTVYVVSHQHYCSNIGGFPDTNPRSIWHRATAFTTQATGTVAPNGESGGGYGDFRGQPSPSLIDWLPDLDNGTYTGQSQAAWSVSGNSQYVVLGGEFPKVNGVAQQGLVRFAIPSVAPDKQGLRLSASQITTTATALSSTSAAISWSGDWDRDDYNLTYSVARNGAIVRSLAAASPSWNLPKLGFTDTGLSPGTTYTYKVKVTDSDGNYATSNAFTVTTPSSSDVVNAPPAASFTLNPSGLAITTDASASTDSDGTIASYSWDFGDGATASGATAAHTYVIAGSYVVTLTATDNSGATDVSTKLISVLPANQPPTASFTATPNGPAVSVDATASNDSDGSIAGYAWDFGDGGHAGGATATHTYSASGSYTITLTVTDDRGATSTATNTVNVVVPASPLHPAFTESANLTTAQFDATSTSGGSGTISSYAWNFGDGTTGAGVTASHHYGSGGTYTVTLTVTDSSAATANVSQAITVDDLIAADTFTRTASSGWGTADRGGVWSRTGGASNFSVNGSQAVVNLPSPGSAPTASLDAVSATDVNMLIDAGINQAPTGDGVYLVLFARHSSTGDYRLRLRLMPGGVVHLAWSRVVAGKETVVSEVVAKNLTYTVGDMLRVRFQVSGRGDGTTALKGSVWNPSTGTEPAAPQINGTDATAALQGAGSVGVYTGLAYNATASPVTARYDNLSVRLS